MLTRFAFARSRPFFDRRMGQEIDGEVMGDDFKGYVFKITGGNDAQGFAMKQGIMRQGRARILFKKSKCIRLLGGRARSCVFLPILSI